MRNFLSREFGPVESRRDLLGIVLLITGGLSLGVFGTVVWLNVVGYLAGGVGAGLSTVAALTGAALRPGTEKAQWIYGIVGLLMANMGVLVATDEAGGVVTTWLFGLAGTVLLARRDPILLTTGFGGFGGGDGGGGC